MILNDQAYQEFLKFASAKHANQLRKDGSPYIDHPSRVANLAQGIAIECGMMPWSINVARFAGLAHDLIEDTATDYDDVVRYCGVTVADVVAALSDDKRLPAQRRHVVYVERIRYGDRNCHIVKLADILDNATDAAGLPPSPWLSTWLVRAEELLAAIHQPLLGTTHGTRAGEALDVLRQRVVGARLSTP